MLEFLFNIGPDLSVLEEGEQLNHFHVLLFFEAELVEVETYAEHGGEDYLAQVELLHILGEHA